MRSLGIRHYRFSLSWPRIFPDGTVNGTNGVKGKDEAGGSGSRASSSSFAGLNPAGIAYYDRLVDGCLSRGITPWITLYHWDLPLALYHKGGWMNRETAEHFADYAAFVSAHFKGRVTNYITINEPQCAIGLGMGNGLHAPGLQLDPQTLFRCWQPCSGAGTICCWRTDLPSARSADKCRMRRSELPLPARWLICMICRGMIPTETEPWRRRRPCGQLPSVPSRPM